MSKNRRGFYPSQRKKAEQYDFIDFEDQDLNLTMNLNDMIKPPFIMKDEIPNSVFNSWKNIAINDEWINPVASINSNNSIGNLTHFLINRLSYSDCAALSMDTIIHKAINTIKNEILNKGGDFIIKVEDQNRRKELEQKLNERLYNLKFWDHMGDLIYKSLVFGTSFIYISTNSTNISLPLKNDFPGREVIESLKVVEPWLVGVSSVNSTNPLKDDYMKPIEWYVSGGSQVHSSRFVSMSFFMVPDLIKPLFNYGGISLCQIMKDYVKDAENIRKSLSELFLRFRTMILKTPLARNNLELAKARSKAIAKQKNNLGIMLLAEGEDYVETITPIGGLDKIQSQAFENMVISSSIPATKLLGISPSGFNSTGEFDLSNYYDTISGYQNNIVKPIIINIAQMILFDIAEEDIKVSFEFKPLVKLNEKEIAETKNLYVDIISKLYDAGIISIDQSSDLLKDNNVLPESFNLEVNEDPNDLDLNLDLDKEIEEIS